MNMKNVRRAAGWILVPLAAAILSFSNAVAGQPVDVKDVWLKRNCLDKGTADYPLGGDDFEACLRKKIENLPALDKSKREFFGEKYDPSKYVECRLRPGSRNNSACNVYTLRRQQWPEYWPEGAIRFKWPKAPKESIYKRGMTPREYWNSLCKADAGEFVYRSVKDADGFLLVRPRGSETDRAMQDRYVIEDGYGLHEFAFGDDESRPGKRVFRLATGNYRYVESAIFTPQRGLVWIRHSLERDKLELLLRAKPAKWDESDFTVVSEVDHPRSRYGVSWRGIRRVNDTDLGISGGELAIADLSTGELLALRRGYAVDGFAVRDIRDRRSWMTSWGCPILARNPRTLRDFVRKVLLPPAVSD